MKNLTVDIFTANPLWEPSSGRRLLALLEAHASAAMPGPWGRDEPFRHRWADDQAEQAFQVGQDLVSFRSAQKHAADLDVFSPRGRRKTRGHVHMTADDLVVDPGGVVAFVKAASQAFGADYAHVHLLAEADTTRRPRHETGYVGWSDTAGEYQLMVIEQELRQCMIELWWGTVFGPEYVRLVGAEVIESAPAYRVERLGEEMFWVQLTEDVRDNLVHHVQLTEVRARVKHHLGDDLFWSPERSEYRAPRLEPLNAGSAPARSQQTR